MRDDSIEVKRRSSYRKETEALRGTETKEPWRPQPAHYSQSFRDRFVLLRVGKRSKTSSTAGLALAVTTWCMKDGWRLSKRQSPTRTSSPCCGPTRRSAASRSRAVGGAVSRLTHPLYHSTLRLCPPSMLSSQAIHTFFSHHSPTFTPQRVALLLIVVTSTLF